jgi:hypothetical protein
MDFDVPYPCPFCLDGLRPAGIHDDLGPVYATCLDCQLICPSCEGEGLFPADETCRGCFAATLAGRGLAALRCAHCLGVVDLIPTDHPEVFPHGHH